MNDRPLNPSFLNGKNLFFIAGLLASFLVFGMELAKPGQLRVLNTKGPAEIYNSTRSRWRPLQSGDLISAEDRFRTALNGEIHLKLSAQASVFLEARTQAESVMPSFFAAAPEYEIRLFEGALLGAVTPGPGVLKITTANSIFRIWSGVFRVSAGPGAGQETVYVLDGEVEVQRRSDREGVWSTVRPMERLKVSKDVVYFPKPLDLEDWRLASKAYTLRLMPAGFQENQKKLCREAGNFFRLLGDQGDFYTPQTGYFRREFVKDAESSGILLYAYYDVTDPGAFAGYYMKLTRFPPAGFDFLEFEARSIDGHVPGSLYLEFKSGGEVKLSFPITGLSGEWKKFQVPLATIRKAKIDEAILYLSYGMAGKEKRGNLVFRNFNLVSGAEAHDRS